MPQFPHNLPPESRKRVEAVPKRFSFHDANLQREDIFISRHPSGRVIQYPTPEPATEIVRSRIARLGLLLGAPTDSPEVGKDRFIIPETARPMGYDANVQAEGQPHLYDDKRMFFDLGLLLRSLAETDKDARLGLAGTIGGNVALLEFTPVGQQKLLLVPGFEWRVKLASDSMRLRNDYEVQIRQEFGDRFENSIASFEQGYRYVR